MKSKLGEATGLAMAAQAATRKVSAFCKGGAEDLVPDLERMNQEAAVTERHCTEFAGTLEGKKTAILEEAQATSNKASEMMSTYLDADADALDGFEFLTMAEAGEVGHWSVLKVLAGKAGSREIGDLAEWALSIQEGHLMGVKQASLQLASEEDPHEAA